MGETAVDTRPRDASPAPASTPEPLAINLDELTPEQRGDWLTLHVRETARTGMSGDPHKECETYLSKCDLRIISPGGVLEAQGLGSPDLIAAVGNLIGRRGWVWPGGADGLTGEQRTLVAQHALVYAIDQKLRGASASGARVEITVEDLRSAALDLNLPRLFPGRAPTASPAATPPSPSAEPGSSPAPAASPAAPPFQVNQLSPLGADMNAPLNPPLMVANREFRTAGEFLAYVRDNLKPWQYHPSHFTDGYGPGWETAVTQNIVAQLLRDLDRQKPGWHERVRDGMRAPYDSPEAFMESLKAAALAVSQRATADPASYGADVAFHLQPYAEVVLDTSTRLGVPSEDLHKLPHEIRLDGRSFQNVAGLRRYVEDNLDSLVPNHVSSGLGKSEFVRELLQRYLTEAGRAAGGDWRRGLLDSTTTYVSAGMGSSPPITTYFYNVSPDSLRAAAGAMIREAAAPVRIASPDGSDGQSFANREAFLKFLANVPDGTSISPEQRNAATRLYAQLRDSGALQRVDGQVTVASASLEEVMGRSGGVPTATPVEPGTDSADTARSPVVSYRLPLTVPTDATGFHYTDQHGVTVVCNSPEQLVRMVKDRIISSPTWQKSFANANVPLTDANAETLANNWVALALRDHSYKVSNFTGTYVVDINKTLGPPQNPEASDPNKDLVPGSLEHRLAQDGGWPRLGLTPEEVAQLARSAPAGATGADTVVDEPTPVTTTGPDGTPAGGAGGPGARAAGGPAPAGAGGPTPAPVEPMKPSVTLDTDPLPPLKGSVSYVEYDRRGRSHLRRLDIASAEDLVGLIVSNPHAELVEEAQKYENPDVFILHAANEVAREVYHRKGANARLTVHELQEIGRSVLGRLEAQGIALRAESPSPTRPIEFQSIVDPRSPTEGRSPEQNTAFEQRARAMLERKLGAIGGAFPSPGGSVVSIDDATWEQVKKLLIDVKRFDGQYVSDADLETRINKLIQPETDDPAAQGAVAIRVEGGNAVVVPRTDAEFIEHLARIDRAGASISSNPAMREAGREVSGRVQAVINENAEALREYYKPWRVDMRRREAISDEIDAFRRDTGWQGAPLSPGRHPDAPYLADSRDRIAGAVDGARRIGETYGPEQVGPALARELESRGGGAPAATGATVNPQLAAERRRLEIVAGMERTADTALNGALQVTGVSRATFNSAVTALPPDFAKLSQTEQLRLLRETLGAALEEPLLPATATDENLAKTIEAWKHWHGRHQQHLRQQALLADVYGQGTSLNDFKTQSDESYRAYQDALRVHHIDEKQLTEIVEGIATYNDLTPEKKVEVIRQGYTGRGLTPPNEYSLGKVVEALDTWSAAYMVWEEAKQIRERVAA